MAGRAVGRHWTVIETGGNQAYIFAANKQMINVGASELVWRVGNQWAREAASSQGERVEAVVVASGKALLLVDHPDTGRAVIRAVTERALTEAPGLEVWGVVDPTPVADDDDVGPALSRAYRLHAAWRGRRPAPLLRSPILPFTVPCRFTGQPAVGFARDNDRPVPVSARYLAAAELRDAGRARMAGDFGNRAVAQPTAANDGVRRQGWIAVLHADGNGIGEVFQRLAEVYTGDEFLDRLRAFSHALDEVTRAALREAVDKQDRPGQDGWLLPLIVGGDDVTAVLDGRLAFDLARDFLLAFERRSRECRALTEVVTRVREHAGQPPAGGGLTASVGIAYVKPHYTFSAAYRLAEELCSSAKAVKHHAPGCGGLDFHVLHDSVGRPLSRLREPLTVTWQGPLRLWPGPVVVTGQDPPESRWACARDVRHLAAAMTTVASGDAGGPVLSRAGLHQLRRALLAGGAAIDRAREQVLLWAAGDTGTAIRAARTFLEQHLRVPVDGEDAAFSRVLGAMDLVDMAVGTAEPADPRPVGVAA